MTDMSDPDNHQPKFDFTAMVEGLRKGHYDVEAKVADSRLHEIQMTEPFRGVLRQLREEKEAAQLQVDRQRHAEAERLRREADKEVELARLKIQAEKVALDKRAEELALERRSTEAAQLAARSRSFGSRAVTGTNASIATVRTRSVRTHCNSR